MTSPLVTGSSSTQTTANQGIAIRQVRRHQLCRPHPNCLNIADLCQIALPLIEEENRRSGVWRARCRMQFSPAWSNPSPPLTHYFYRSASELLCEAAANLVVDGSQYKVFSPTMLRWRLRIWCEHVDGKRRCLRIRNTPAPSAY